MWVWIIYCIYYSIKVKKKKKKYLEILNYCFELYYYYKIINKIYIYIYFNNHNIGMAITLPNDIRPVIKSYSGKKLSEAFMEHQNILREKFNEQNNEILRKRELKKSNTESGMFYFFIKKK